MAPHAQEAASADDGIGHGLVRCDDDVVDRPDGLTLVVEDLFSENLASGAPACRDLADLGIGYSQLRRTNNLWAILGEVANSRS